MEIEVRPEVKELIEKKVKAISKYFTNVEVLNRNTFKGVRRDGEVCKIVVKDNGGSPFMWVNGEPVCFLD